MAGDGKQPGGAQTPPTDPEHAFKDVFIRPSDGKLTVGFYAVNETVTQPVLNVLNALIAQMFSRWVLTDDDLVRICRYVAARIMVQRIAARHQGQIDAADPLQRAKLLEYANKTMDSLAAIVAAELVIGMDKAAEVQANAASTKGDDASPAPSDPKKIH